MLVLTRKHQEKIRIGEHITITVLKTKGKTVRLGIEAPAEIPVIRGELSFEGKTIEWQVEEEETEPAPTRKVTDFAHVDRVGKHWPTDGKPTDATSQVSLQRISREQMSKLLPNSGSGAAPLRALVERRSVSA